MTFIQYKTQYILKFKVFALTFSNVISCVFLSFTKYSNISSDKIKMIDEFSELIFYIPIITEPLQRKKSKIIPLDIK